MIYTGLILIVLFIFNSIFKDCISNNIIIIEGVISILLLIFIMIYGTINSNILYTTRYKVNINKKCKINQLKIVLIADLHLGYNKGIKLVKKMVKKINDESPDIVLIAGDIFDNDYDAVEKPKEMIKEFKKIKARYGIYSVYGNHDIKEKVLLGFTFQNKKQKYSDKRMDKLLKFSKIKLLQDNYILIDDSIYIYGRIDKEKNKCRKSASYIVKTLDKKNIIIVLDHTPKELEQLAKARVDLDLSGHTHNGQIFPLNYLVKLIFKNSYGIKKFYDMTSIVTSGVGVYGPSMRVLSKSEIVSINIVFK